MSDTSKSVTFLYNTAVGRSILKVIMKMHLDRIAIWFLRSSYSRPVIKRFAKRNGIAMAESELKGFRTYRDFFIRKKENLPFDKNPNHLISPCDGLLSVFPIREDSTFAIKNSHYRVCDFLRDEALADKYLGGTCLVFRLCVSDYHHYCYVDDGYQGENHSIPGVLHSVQPIACENFPVFVLNKRSWCLMETENFGPVVQCEIGALVVGGIVNDLENTNISKGTEKGHFELAGSTIVLLLEADRIEINAELQKKLSENEEVRVSLGQWIATAQNP